MRLPKKIRSVFDTLPNPTRVPPDFDRQVLLLKAMAYIDNNGFTNPLSALVIFDTFLEFGHMPAHLTHFIPLQLPKDGGYEDLWRTWLLFLRSTWLGNCRNPNLNADPREAILQLKMKELK